MTGRAREVRPTGTPLRHAGALQHRHHPGFLLLTFSHAQHSAQHTTIKVEGSNPVQRYEEKGPVITFHPLDSDLTIQEGTSTT